MMLTGRRQGLERGRTVHAETCGELQPQGSAAALRLTDPWQVTGMLLGGSGTVLDPLADPPRGS